MRYVVSIGDDETGPLLADKDTNEVLIFHSHELACEAARMLVKDGSLPHDFGAFVQKIVPTAFYLPVDGPSKSTKDRYVDETILTDETPKLGDLHGGDN